MRCLNEHPLFYLSETDRGIVLKFIIHIYVYCWESISWKLFTCREGTVLHAHAHASIFDISKTAETVCVIIKIYL